MNDRMTIAEASRLADLSPETIRHYERLGILHPDRNEQTGYRYYSLRDICLLGKIQSFLQCGFSLKDIKRMINDMCLSDLETVFDAHTRELENQMIESMKQIQGLRRKSRQMSIIEANLDKFSIKNRPHMYLLEAYKDNKLLAIPGIEAQHAAWFKRQIFTFPYMRWEDQSTVQGNHQITQYVGLGIEKSDFEASGLTYTSLINNYPETPCVYTVMAMRNTNTEVKKTVMERIDAYMKENKLQQAGDILFETVFLSEQDGKPIYFRNVWIPYK